MMPATRAFYPFLFSAVLLAGGLLQPGRAAAFGNESDTSLAVDRATGIYRGDSGQDPVLNLGLGSPPLFGINPYIIPRFSLDHLISPQLSLGGSLSFWYRSRERADRPAERLNGFLLAPRLGYVIPISEGFGFWPRGGLSYWATENDDELALYAEATFYGAIGAHFGLTFGPVVDLGLLGDGQVGHSLGLMSAGLFGLW